MCKLSKSGKLLIDEIELEAQLTRNKIADIIQGEFALEMNRLVHREARRTCQGCWKNNPSQKHHQCLVLQEEEIWIYHFDKAKKHLNVDKLWSKIEEQINKKLDVYLQDSWLKYLLNLLKVDESSAFLLYKYFERKQLDEQVDECVKFNCYDYM